MADEQTPASATARRWRPIWLGALVLGVAFLAGYGIWYRATADGPGGPSAPAPLMVEAQSRGTALPAIGRLTGIDEPCTAWLLDAGAPAGARAQAVTTARCVGLVDAQAVLTDRPVRGASVEFNAFAPRTADDQPNPVVVDVRRVTWASLRWTDLALLELGSTYGELADRGVLPIQAVQAPEEGAEILVAGVPVAGIAPDLQFLRGSRCQLGAASEVLEYRWLWADMNAVACTGILGGSLGSPALTSSGAAIGLVATTTIGSGDGHECFLGRPCQVRDGQVRQLADTSYLAGVGGLGTCFVDGRLRLGGSCPLEQPASVVPAASVVRTARPGTVVEVRLGPGVDEAAVEVVSGPLAEVDCRDPAGWALPTVPTPSAPASPGAATAIDEPTATGEPTPTASVTAGADPTAAGSAWPLPVLLPDRDGFTLVCVGSAAHPTAVVLEADGTPADPGDITLNQVAVQGGVQVQPVVAAPDLVRFRWVSAPAGTIDCATAEGYVEYTGTPATIQADDLPSTVCVLGYDEADNESAPASITVDGLASPGAEQAVAVRMAP